MTANTELSGLIGFKKELFSDEDEFDLELEALPQGDMWFSYGSVRLHAQTSRTLPWAIRGTDFTFLPDLSLSQPEQADCRHKVRELINTAGEQNWDGEDADPVLQETIGVALMTISEFPSDMGTPDVSADPHGNVDFDWLCDNGAMFTLSVGKNGEVAISGLYKGESKLTGMAWDKQKDIPSLVRCGLEWLRETKER